MKIVTINIPISYIKAIETIIGDKGPYPSRSELIRVALREFLIREVSQIESFQTFQGHVENKNKEKEYQCSHCGSPVVGKRFASGETLCPVCGQGEMEEV